MIICVDCNHISENDDEYATKWEQGDWVPYGDTQAQLPGHWVCARCGGELEDYVEEDDDDDECGEQDSKLFCGENGK